MSLSKEKLKWRSRRSMLELDLLLNKFIQNGGLDLLNSKELYLYNQMLEMDDGDLLLLFQGKEPKVQIDNNLHFLIAQIAKFYIKNGE